MNEIAEGRNEEKTRDKLLLDRLLNIELQPSYADHITSEETNAFPGWIM